LWDAIDRGQPGTTVRLAINRPGDSRVANVAVRLDAYRLPIGFGSTQLTSVLYQKLRDLNRPAFSTKLARCMKRYSVS
jgi:hypothetical protein